MGQALTTEHVEHNTDLSVDQFTLPADIRTLIAMKSR